MAEGEAVKRKALEKEESKINSDYAQGLPVKISIKRLNLLCVGELTEKGWKKRLSAVQLQILEMDFKEGITYYIDKV